jgi:hypothetical protein
MRKEWFGLAAIILLLIFSNCAINHIDLINIQNVDVFDLSDYSVGDKMVKQYIGSIRIYDFPFGGVYEQWVGSIENGKLSFILPKEIHEDYLFDPSTLETYYNITPGIKYTQFEFEPLIVLHKKISDYSSEYYEYWYTNKDGEFTASGINYKLKRGWNLVNFLTGDSTNNIKILYDKGYKWFCYPE